VQPGGAISRYPGGTRGEPAPQPGCL